jgi:uncharacterized protein (TIRG00374 family)
MSFALRLAFSLAVFGIVFYVVDFGETLAVLGGMHAPLLLAAFACLLLTRFLVGFKWWLLLGGRQAAVTYPTVQRAILLADYQGLLFPNTLAIDALRLILLRNHPGGMTYLTSTILADRFLNTMVAAGAALIGIAVLSLVSADAYLSPVVIITVIVSASLMLLLGIATTSEHLLSRVVCIVRRLFAHSPLVERILYKAAELQGSTKTILTDPLTVIKAVFVSLAVVIFRASVVYFLFAAIGTWLGLLSVLAVYPIMMLIVLLPISILGIGVQDSAFIFFFGGLGVAASPTLAVSLAVYALILLVGLAAGLIAGMVGPAMPTAATERPGSTRKSTQRD